MWINEIGFVLKGRSAQQRIDFINGRAKSYIKYYHIPAISRVSINSPGVIEILGDREAILALATLAYNFYKWYRGSFKVRSGQE